MPSSSFVEIDIQNNDTAILDTQNVVIASEQSDAISPKAKVSQSQDDQEETVVSPTPKKMKTSTKTNEAESAKPSEKAAALSVVTPRAKSATKAATTSLTPPKGAVATPGDSVKKEKKNVRTLDSFFGMGKKKDVATKPLLKIGSKAEGKKVQKKSGVQKKSADKSKDVQERKDEAEKVDVAKKSKSVEKSDEANGAAAKKVAAEPADSPMELEEDTSPGYALSMALAQTRTKKGKRSASTRAVEKVGDRPAEKTEAKADGAVKDAHVEEAKQAIVDTTVVAAESKDVCMKDSDPADDDTVELEASKIPPPAYDSSSEASDVEMEDVVAGPEEVSPIKTDESASSPSAKSDKPSKSAEVTSIADSLGAAASPPKSESAESTAKKETASDTSKPAEVASQAPLSASKPAKPAVKKDTSKSKAAKASSKAESVPLSEENQARMKQYTTLRERYVARAIEVASRSTSDDFVEESLSNDELPSLAKGSVEVGEDGGFPDELMPLLLVLVQGR